MSEKYIITFESTASKEEIDAYKEAVTSNGKLLHSSHIIRDGYRGFSATLKPETFKMFQQESFMGKPNIILDIEKDGPVNIQ
ncbi:hypothetical protein DFH06DRAFT_1315114 [Mycena polygramma]|nr:hypothetical protein DFH06DRAFT_1315114 [Mycena polygramma]